MHIRFTKLLLPFIFLLLAVVTSCQKDSDSAEPDGAKTSLAADSAAFSSQGNFLATSGTLNIKFNDSTYTFDAATDSIAFINVHVADSIQYFGITAINKAHNMSFGISSSGLAATNINRSIAGSQFLLNNDDKHLPLQLSLSKYSGQKDFGNINIIQYNHSGTLAKGTFYTFLASDDKSNSPFYRIEGSFDLKLK